MVVLGSGLLFANVGLSLLPVSNWETVVMLVEDDVLIAFL